MKALSVKVIIFNEQSCLRISKKAVVKQVLALLELEKQACSEIVVHFVNKKKITALHKKFFSDPTPTDCISFPLDGPDELYRILGEVFICTEVAQEYALKHRLNPYDEATLYLIHSILHLLGYDDIDLESRRTMKKKEKKCMNFLIGKKLAMGTSHARAWKQEGAT